MWLDQDNNNFPTLCRADLSLELGSKLPPVSDSSWLHAGWICVTVCANKMGLAQQTSRQGHTYLKGKSKKGQLKGSLIYQSKI